MTANRNLKSFFEAVSQNPNVQVVDAAEPGRYGGLDSMIPALVAAVLGFIAGYSWGQHAIKSAGGNDLTTLPLALGTTIALIAYAAVYAWSLSAGAVRFYAEFTNEGEEPEQRPSFIETERQGELRRLDGKMKNYLRRFAQHYDEIGTCAIEAWWRSKYLNRAAIEEVRDYLPKIGAAYTEIKDGRTFVHLTRRGIEQLPKWAAGDFSAVFELVE